MARAEGLIEQLKADSDKLKLAPQRSSLVINRPITLNFGKKKENKEPKDKEGGACTHAQGGGQEIQDLKTEQKSMESKLEEEFSKVFRLIEELTKSFLTKFEKLQEDCGNKGGKGGKEEAGGGAGMSAK